MISLVRQLTFLFGLYGTSVFTEILVTVDCAFAKEPERYRRYALSFISCSVILHLLLRLCYHHVYEFILEFQTFIYSKKLLLKNIEYNDHANFLISIILIIGIAIGISERPRFTSRTCCFCIKVVVSTSHSYIIVVVVIFILQH